MSRREVLDHYRQRGTAEGHMGELKDVLAPALSSTNRPKSHWLSNGIQSGPPIGVEKGPPFRAFFAQP
jgi:hypothetical protein